MRWPGKLRSADRGRRGWGGAPLRRAQPAGKARDGNVRTPSERTETAPKDGKTAETSGTKETITEGEEPPTPERMTPDVGARGVAASRETAKTGRKSQAGLGNHGGLRGPLHRLFSSPSDRKPFQGSSRARRDLHFYSRMNTAGVRARASSGHSQGRHEKASGQRDSDSNRGVQSQTL